MEKSVKNKLEEFFSKYQVQTFRKNKIIIHSDASPGGVYFLRKGYVREYSISPHGVETTLHYFSPGSFFPMTWVIADIPNRYYFESLMQTELVRAPKEKVVRFLRKNPDVILDLTSRLLKGLDKILLRIEQLSYSQANTRIASILLFLAKHFGEKNTNGKILLTEVFTHKDIASLAGLTRETTSREWKKLEEKGIVSHSKRNIIINNFQLLEKEIA